MIGQPAVYGQADAKERGQLLCSGLGISDHRHGSFLNWRRCLPGSHSVFSILL
jgi:hypothetical protein